MRILFVDASLSYARSVADTLRRDGFVVDHAESIEDARAAIRVASYVAILTERVLPDGDGLDWVREQRRSGNAVPILIITGERGAVSQRVEGLNAGADDYIVKPVPFDELSARIRAVLRRPSSALGPILRVGNIEFDPAIREARIAGRVMRMPRRETCILEMLIRRAGKTVTKSLLEEGLYSFDDEISSNAIEVGIYRLRGHLQGAGATATIRTVRGTGYVLECAEDLPNEVPTAVRIAANVAAALSDGIETSKAPITDVEPQPEVQVAILAAALALRMTQLSRA